MGWEIINLKPPGMGKAIVTAAPHTSNMDFLIAKLAYSVIGVKVKFLIKKEAFSWPFGGWLKAMGGIPVDRSRKNRIVDQVVDLFNQSDSLYVVITPEGTRKPRPRWKRGFYHIAMGAKVPIALGFIDYGNKTAGIGKIMMPTGDVEKDMLKIKNFYKDFTPRHPERFRTGLEG